MIWPTQIQSVCKWTKAGTICIIQIGWRFWKVDENLQLYKQTQRYTDISIDLKYIFCFFDDDILRANILVIKGCRDQFGSAGAAEVAEHGECEGLPVTVVPVPVEVVHHEVPVVRGGDGALPDIKLADCSVKSKMNWPVILQSKVINVDIRFIDAISALYHGQYLLMMPPSPSEPRTGPHRSQSRVLVKQRYPSWHLDRRCLRRYPCLHLAQIRYTVSTVSHSQNIHGFAKQ